ncbi:MAG: hypothetical protein K940chlam1_00614 [Candidatus Anoxychlamydiales bacterium]|nr:hypothetical protein [Candidatus Anoxychlamydiales bacterium]NGX35719.1 hypothetical protein [Candidatus Anoxychlamydiales bacterium]
MFGFSFFDNILTLIYGSIAGFLFGFLLRKAKVTRFDVIVKQLLLKDFTVMKVIFTAIIVGSIGIYTMLGFNLIGLSISDATQGAVIIGGSIFGIGMAIMGYCPGTGIAALADGSRDMFFGLIGMLTGAAIFAEAYPYITKYMKLTDNSAMQTLASITKISPWFFIVVLTLFAISFFYFLDKKFKKPTYE